MNPKSSFRRFIEAVVKLPCDLFGMVVLCVAVFVGMVSNSISVNQLPMLEVLATGFTAIMCIVDYSIKQLCQFCTTMQNTVTDDSLLRAYQKLEKKMYSNKNWLIVLALPAGIVPAVDCMLGCPLSLPVKVYTYIGLYAILAWCFVGYTLYVNFVLMLRECSKGTQQITNYNKEQPSKTDWVVKMKEQSDRYSSMFFAAGIGFIVLFSFILGSGLYGVDLTSVAMGAATAYLWIIVAVAIILAFLFFAGCSDTYITNLVSNLKKKESQLQ